MQAAFCAGILMLRRSRSLLQKRTLGDCCHLAVRRAGNAFGIGFHPFIILLLTLWSDSRKWTFRATISQLSNLTTQLTALVISTKRTMWGRRLRLQGDLWTFFPQGQGRGKIIKMVNYLWYEVKRDSWATNFSSGDCSQIFYKDIS